MADGPQRRSSDLPHPFGDVIGHPEQLIPMLIEKEVGAEVRATHVPVEVLGLDIDREHVGHQRGKCARDIRYRVRGDVSVWCEASLATCGQLRPSCLGHIFPLLRWTVWDFPPQRTRQGAMRFRIPSRRTSVWNRI